MSHMQTLWVFGFVCLLGCSGSDQPDLGLVTGRVTLDGEPVSGAMLTFTPTPEAKTQQLAYAGTDDNGNYEAVFRENVKGVPVGPRQVAITTDEGARWKGKELTRRVQLFPPRYNEKTELNIEVKPGENVFNFECTSDGKDKP